MKRMNRKGESNYIGIILIAFVVIVVGIALFQAAAQQVGESVNTVALENDTTMTIAVNDTAQYITTCRALSGVVIFNETNDVPVPSAQYAVVNNVVHPTTGDLSVSITPDAAAEYKTIWTIDATCQPLTYITDSGGRAMANIIIIFFALAIAVVGLYLVYEGKLKELMGM